MLRLLFSVAALIFLFRWLQALYCFRWAHRLPILRQPLAHRPRVSVVLAARDEEARVEQTLRHILAQEHIDVEVIPVSDRGRDRTDCILEQLAEGWHDDEVSEVRSRAASLIRGLAEHAARNGQQITLEMSRTPMSGLATRL